MLPRLLTGAQKENRVTVSQELFDRSNAALLSRFGPCGHFLVPEFEILTKRSPISDGRGDRRKIRHRTFVLSRKTRSRTRSRTGKNVGSGISRVEGSTLKETSLIKLYVKQ